VKKKEEYLAKKGRRKDQDLFAAWFLCEILIKKTLAKKDNLSQAGFSFFSREGAETCPPRWAQRNAADQH
jgi:hypothetical protein